jgi:secreted trypsin-like serine protease
MLAQHGTMPAMRCALGARLVVVAAITLAGSPAAADPGASTGPGVVGGSDVPEGEWRDTAGVIIDGIVNCTGVLIAPTVALTAGHCNDPQLTAILVGTNDLSQPQRGETIGVVERITYPDADETLDLTALVLERPSTVPPRAVATGWARVDIADGARVALVGFGAIDREASQYVDELQAAETTITNAACDDDALGCNPGARPAGELGAGGMGIDTCPGDSGGPLYLRTGYGDFVAGITSRGYLTSQVPCEDGGIYTRPDAAVAWIEMVTGVLVARAPEPTAPPIVVPRGDGADTDIEVNDPIGTRHEFAIAAPPTAGRAAVDADGHVRYCADATAPGVDAITVAVTDRDTPSRRVLVTIPVEIQDGTPPAEECSVDTGGGCCAAGQPLDGGAALLGVLVGAALLRRRR